MSSEPTLLPAISSGFESLERGKGGRRKEERGGVGRGGVGRGGVGRGRTGGNKESMWRGSIKGRIRVWESVWEGKESSV